MKHMHRALVLLLTAALIVTACIPATLVGLAAETQDAATAPTEATQATQIAATESSETTLPSEAAIPTDTTDTTEETTVPTVADQLSTEELFTVSFDLNGGTVCTRGAGGLTVSAATGQEITMPDEDETEAEAAAEVQTTFWGRVAQMFKDFWAAITGLFGGKD